MEKKANMSYREVIPRNIKPEEWIELEINTGTQSTLQDIKAFGKSGSYCYNCYSNAQNRNRFIYWRTYQDVVELSEISFDVSLDRNHLRLRFTDTAVLNASLSEYEDIVTLLVVTVSSVHRIVFPMQSNDASSIHVSASVDSHRNSVFYDASSYLKDRHTFHVIDAAMAINVPHLAACEMSANNEEAYFAIDYHPKLMLHIMNPRTGSTVSHEVKESQLMPRFLSHLKGALIGRGENLEGAISMAFSHIEGETFLLVLYRNNELRLWSLTTLQTVASYMCMDQSARGPQTSSMRKIDDLNFCVFLSYETNSEFKCLSIECNLNEMNTRTMSIVVSQNVPAPPMDLADFQATSSHIWSLWSNAEGDINISGIFLNTDNRIKWVSAALEPPPDRYCLTIEQGVDPREAYCSYIFHPGRFDRNVIAKALSMFRRVNIQFDTKQLTMGMLKEQVCQSVEDEIQTELKDFVVSDEEYLEIAIRLWDRFYSCCEQYHIKFSEPIGLSVLDAMDIVCVIRRQSFALLRPCEMLEHLMLVGNQNNDVESFVALYCHNDLTAAQRFLGLMDVIRDLEKLLSEDVKMEMDKKIYQRDEAVLVNLLLQITKGNNNDNLALSPECVAEIQKKLDSIVNAEKAIKMLLDALVIDDNDAYPDSAGGYNKQTRFMQSNGALFGSEYGISILAETVKQVAMIRYAVCRNLLILQYFQNGKVCKTDGTIRTNTNFLNSYYTLVWICETPISLNAPVNFEVSIQRLTRAQIFSGYTRPYSSKIGLNNQTTLLCLFLQSKGIFSALSMLLNQPNLLMDQLSLRETLMQLVGCINQMLWPEVSNDIFPEWLFGTCHHIIIQDYVRLVSDWCAEKSNSRIFILAVSLLDCGEQQKAIHLFEQIEYSILSEPFLFEQVLKNTPLYVNLQGIRNRQKCEPTESEVKQALVYYYLKVIQLFEQHSAHDCIIQLACRAMHKLNVADAQLPMFQSIVFNNHLQLGHYEEAFDALVYNADISRRKDCLRQLVIMLFQCKRFDLLMNLNYNSLQADFENIVESRARSLSIDQNEVYNFLYAFHVNNGSMRKAATVMYEQAMRLMVDSDAPDALHKRCSSLLICINCLYLVDERYRWIAKPSIGDDKSTVYLDNNKDRNSQLDFHKINEVVVLELNDIRRELLKAEALRELTHHRKEVSANQMTSAEELCYLFATCGLYTAALKLALGHELRVLHIFESLTAACVSITEDNNKDAWAWLQNNDLADLAHCNNATDTAWSLLQKLVVDNELDNSTAIRKCVVNRILTMNAFVPQWLYDSYKMANSRELLYLLVNHNRLLDATDLACEIIGGMLGAGSEYFDFKHSVNVTNPQLVFPVNTIDLLLHGLQINGSKHVEYEMAHTKLEEDVARYIETVKRTTEDKIKLAILSDRENRQQEIFG